MSPEPSDPKVRGPKPPIPVSVLTGFLGAGKTTLLSALLKQPGMADTAVIINEFGEIGLDHLLVETADEGIVELKGGCLCCSIRGDLIQTLEDLLRARDNGRVTPFTRVVIETTGLADPAPVLHSVMFHPYLVLRYRLDSVVTVIDAVNAMATLDAHEESVRQVAVADRIVVTKTDLQEGMANAAALGGRLADLNPAARVLDASSGEAVAERLFDAGLYNPRSKAPDVAGWLHADAYGDAGHAPDDHAHDGHGGHTHHDVNRHDDRIRAFSVRLDRPIALAGLEMFLDLLRAQHGEELLRVKGIIHIADEPDRPLVVHGVQHVFHPPVFLEAWPDEDRSTRMVFITKDADPAQIEGLLKAFSEPERATRTFNVVAADNPLSGGGDGPFRPG